jgi:hypothetical protein
MQAIIVKRIARRTGIKNRPRQLTQSGRTQIPEGSNPRNVARQVLRQVRNLVQHDHHDRQIELARVLTVGRNRHDITSRVLYRVYWSISYEKLVVYPGASHQGERGDLEVTPISVG